LDGALLGLRCRRPEVTATRRPAKARASVDKRRVDCWQQVRTDRQNQAPPRQVRVSPRLPAPPAPLRRVACLHHPARRRAHRVPRSHGPGWPKPTDLPRDPRRRLTCPSIGHSA